MTSDHDQRRHAELTGGQVGWRAAATVAGVLVLLGGQLHDTNDWFPLGSLSQYAIARPTDGSVISTSLEGTTTDGRVIPVALSPGSVGLSRAELESQGTRIIAEPSLLGAVVASRRALHPDAEPLRELRMVRSEQRMRDSVLVGPVEKRVIATWIER